MHPLNKFDLPKDNINFHPHFMLNMNELLKLNELLTSTPKCSQYSKTIYCDINVCIFFS